MSEQQHPAETVHQLGAETPGGWCRVSTTQTMYDGTLLLTWGVQVSESQQWVGKAHAIGSTRPEQAEAFANAGLFAASKSMAGLLIEASQAWSEEFVEDVEISGADLLEWFAEWRQRVRDVLDQAVTP